MNVQLKKKMKKIGKKKEEEKSEELFVNTHTLNSSSHSSYSIPVISRNTSH